MDNDLKNTIDPNLKSLMAAKKPMGNDIDHRPILSKWDMIHFKDGNGDYGMRIFFEDLDFETLEKKRFPKWNEIKINPYITKTKKRLCLDIRITNPSFIGPFDTFSKNIVSGADSCLTENDLLKNIFLKCNQWKLFMQNEKIDELKPFEQQGLIGELTFLKTLIEKIGVKDGLEAWRGPEKEPKDFLFSSIGIEVKTKQGGRKGQVQISSEFQLSIDNLSELFLVVFTIEKSSEINPNSFNLPQKIEEVKSYIIKNDVNYIDEFLGKLYKCRYDEKHKYLDNFWLVVDPYYAFLINENSPVITNENIDCKYLSEIKYKLALEGLKENQLENFDYIFKNL